MTQHQNELKAHLSKLYQQRCELQNSIARAEFAQNDQRNHSLTHVDADSGELVVLLVGDTVETKYGQQGKVMSVEGESVHLRHPGGTVEKVNVNRISSIKEMVCAFNVVN